MESRGSAISIVDGRVMTRSVFAITSAIPSISLTTATENDIEGANIFGEANRLLHPVPTHARALAPPVPLRSFDFSASAE